MAQINNLTLKARLVDEPTVETRGQGQSAFTITKFKVVYSYPTGKKDEMGNTIWSKGEFWNCESSKSLDLNVAHKGDVVVLIGELRNRTYEKDGMNNTYHYINVTHWCLDTRCKANGGGNNDQNGYVQPQYQQAQQQFQNPYVQPQYQQAQQQFQNPYVQPQYQQPQYQNVQAQPQFQQAPVDEYSMEQPAVNLTIDRSKLPF